MVEIPASVIPELNNLRKLKGLPEVDEETLRFMAADEVVQEFSSENRMHEFVKKDMGTSGGKVFLGADFRLIGFFDNCAIFTRSGLTESELESQKLQKALDKLWAEPAIEDESGSEPLDFLAKLREAEARMESGDE